MNDIKTIEIMTSWVAEKLADFVSFDVDADHNVVVTVRRGGVNIDGVQCLIVEGRQDESVLSRRCVSAPNGTTAVLEAHCDALRDVLALVSL